MINPAVQMVHRFLLTNHGMFGSINLNSMTNIQNAKYLNRTCTEIEELASRGDLLSNLLTGLKTCLAHNFTSALLILGASVVTFHFSSICKKYGGRNIPVAIGDPETGKSTAIKAVLCLSGSQESGYYVKGTNAVFLDRASTSTLPFGIDDPHIGKSTRKTN